MRQSKSMPARLVSRAVAAEVSGGAAIVWYRSSDLRVHDHGPLSRAHAAHDHVVHVFCFDDRILGPSAKTDFSRSLPAVNWPKTGLYRSRFLLESIEDLRRTLEHANNGSEAANQTLFVRNGRPEHVLPALVAEVGASAIYCSEGEAPEELCVQRAVRSAISDLKNTGVGCSLHSVWENTMYHLEDLPFETGGPQFPKSATDFRNAVEKKCTIRDPLPCPSIWKPLPCSLDLTHKGDIPATDHLCLPDNIPAPFQGLEHKGVFPFRGGESAGLQRLEEYFFTTDSLRTYFTSRNGMLGSNYSSKFSPWLAHGCISARLINREIDRYERERVKSKETYWMKFELTFRDYFKFYCLHHGSNVFKLYGPKGRSKVGVPKTEWSQDLEVLDKWCRGCTGNPMIDANMRELFSTGYMSNRGRQIVASFLTRDLGIDWRLGAMHFESLLIDHDPSLNWGNWTYSAGVGSDPREDRYFSVPKQTSNYDPEHRYIKHWVPEVAALPPAALSNRLTFGTRQTRHLSSKEHDIQPATDASSRVVTRSITVRKPGKNR